MSAAEPTLTRLVLIRHGESRAIVDRVTGGPKGCRGLTAHGVHQVAALRDRLIATGELSDTTALFSSTLPRAVQTAELLAPAFGEIPFVSDPDLSEMDPGEADGLGWEEFSERFGIVDQTVEPYRPMAPGGESWAEFELRVGRALSRLVTEHGTGCLVVACHGGIIVNSLSNFLPLPGHGPRPSMPSPAYTSITEWHCTRVPGQPWRWSLERFNDAAHLLPGGVPRLWGS